MNNNHDHNCLHEDKIPQIDRKVDKILFHIETEKTGLLSRMTKVEDDIEDLKQNRSSQGLFVTVMCFISTALEAIITLLASLFIK